MDSKKSNVARSEDSELTNARSGFLCPFDGEICSFPDGEHFKSADFVGCKITDYEFGSGDNVLWVCPRFLLNLSITAVRDVFMQFYKGLNDV